ncbi:MAG: hypothetical protein GX282_01715 [Campylobacteraceae bacterium]|nr:hypothetical protein [Campylobacteraceae bacterium]
MLDYTTLSIVLLGVVSNFIVAWIKNFIVGLNFDITSPDYEDRLEELYNTLSKVVEKHGSTSDILKMIIPYAQTLELFFEMSGMVNYMKKHNTDALDYEIAKAKWELNKPSKKK